MLDLTLVGVHDDGEHLVLTAPDGQRYRLTIDEAVRAAVRRDRARLGQLQLAMDGRLTPREIQARIRAGESAEAIAAGSGLEIEHVRRFESPVLAERQHIADMARRVTLRRSAPAAAHPPTLDDVVTHRLEDREADLDDVRWDAWRREDGQWTVAVSFTAAGRERSARWTFSPQLKQVVPADDEARWFVDAEPEESEARRLTAVRGPVYDVGVGGVLRPSPVTAEVEEPAEEPSPGSATVGLLDKLRERRGQRIRPVSPEEDDGTPDAVQEALDTLRAEDRDATDVLDAEDDVDDPAIADEPVRPLPGPSAVPKPGPGPGQGPGRQARRAAGRRSVPDPIRGTHPAGRKLPAERDRVVVLPDTDAATRTAGVAPLLGADPGTQPTAPVPPPTAAAPAPGTAARKGRRNVPSWDDIVFGSRRE